MPANPPDPLAIQRAVEDSLRDGSVVWRIERIAEDAFRRMPPTPQDPSKLQVAVEDVLATSRWFKLMKWAGGGVVVVVLIFFLGGEILNGIKVDSLNKRFRESEQQIADRTKDASQTITQATQNIDQQRREFQGLLSSAQDRVLEDARGRVQKAADAVEAHAAQVTQNMGDRANRVADSMDEQIKKVETRSAQATQAIEQKSEMVGTHAQQAMQASDSKVASIDAHVGQASQTIEQAKNRALERLDSADIPSLPQAREAIKQLEQDVGTLSAQVGRIRFANLGIILGKWYVPVLVFVALGPIFGLLGIVLGVIALWKRRSKSLARTNSV